MEKTRLELFKDWALNVAAIPEIAFPATQICWEREIAERNKEMDAHLLISRTKKEKWLVEDRFCNRIIIPDQELCSHIPDEIHSILPMRPDLKCDSCLAVKVTHVHTPSEFFVCTIGQPACTCSDACTANSNRWNGQTIDEVIKLRPEDFENVDFTNTVRKNHCVLQQEATEEAALGPNQKPCKLKNDFKAQHQPKLPEASFYKNKYVGVSGLNKIICDLTNLIEGRSDDIPRPPYQIYELVAVLMEFRRLEAELIVGYGRFYWLRGIICDYKEIAGKDNYSVYLFDYGAMVTVHVDKILPLPSEFTMEPPLAYKCKLFDVIPTENLWRESDIKKFKRIVNNKFCFMEVKRGCSSSQINTTIDKSTNAVKLVIATMNSFIDVTKELRKLKTVQASSLLTNPIFSNTDKPSWERLSGETMLEQLKITEHSPSASTTKEENGNAAEKASTSTKEFTIGPAILVEAEGQEDPYQSYYSGYC